MEAKQRIAELSAELLMHQRRYYVEGRPTISDLEYDRLCAELAQLERRFPDFVQTNSPLRRVGSDLDHKLVEIPHSIEVLSLDKVYSPADLLAWLGKTGSESNEPWGVTVEEKVDGASIVLYYEKGELNRALTRGNGQVGSDVTENIRTIRQVPLTVSCPGALAVRGEIYLDRDDFSQLNLQQEVPFANPRNLAAGTLRSVRSANVARIPLRLIVYEAHFSQSPPSYHHLGLARLADMGFPLPRTLAYFSDLQSECSRFLESFAGRTCGPLEQLSPYLQGWTQQRARLPYDIDGLVVKIDDLLVRSRLGATSHHPRWAMAFKFDAPQAQTRVIAIQIQVGRNGRVTPVAVLEPVSLSGSIISRATLHNQDYIDQLELAIGDRVAISKRGDVIPAVDEVLEKGAGNPASYRLPAHCPFCLRPLAAGGAHLFCRNEECPERLLRVLIHFCGKQGLDIDTLGEKTLRLLLERKWLHSPADLFNLDWSLLKDVPGFAEKKIANLQHSLQLARQQPFARVLAALGLEALGPAAIESLLAHGFNSMEALISAAAKNDPTVFIEVPGIGPILAEALVRHFSSPDVLKLVARLKDYGLAMSSMPLPALAATGAMSGQEWVITGTFLNFSPRSLAADEIRRRGGRVAERVTASTTHLLCGQAPGSKLQRAISLNVPVIEEDRFLALLK
jgi:DNA ligase (NAD+)